MRGEQLDHLLVGLVEVGGALLVGQVEGADHAPRAPRSARRENERMSGWADGHQPRKSAGCSWMLGVRNELGVSSMAPSSPCWRGSGPIAAMSSSPMPDVRKLAEAALAVGQAERGSV